MRFGLSLNLPPVDFGDHKFIIRKNVETIWRKGHIPDVCQHKWVNRADEAPRVLMLRIPQVTDHLTGLNSIYYLPFFHLFVSPLLDRRVFPWSNQCCAFLFDFWSGGRCWHSPSCFLETELNTRQSAKVDSYHLWAPSCEDPSKATWAPGGLLGAESAR